MACPALTWKGLRNIAQSFDEDPELTGFLSLSRKERRGPRATVLGVAPILWVAFYR